jgi:hypothetical protein
MCTHIRVHACTPYAHVRPDFQQEEEHARGPGSRTGELSGCDPGESSGRRRERARDKEKEGEERERRHVTEKV